MVLNDRVAASLTVIACERLDANLGLDLAEKSRRTLGMLIANLSPISMALLLITSYGFRIKSTGDSSRDIDLNCCKEHGLAVALALGRCMHRIGYSVDFGLRFAEESRRCPQG